MEALEFSRRADRRLSMQVGGFISSTVLYGLLAVSATEEDRIKGLPAFSLYRKKLQNAAGQTYFMPGIDTPGDPNHPIR